MDKVVSHWPSLSCGWPLVQHYYYDRIREMKVKRWHAQTESHMESHAASRMKSALNSMNYPGYVLCIVWTRNRRSSLNYGVENDFRMRVVVPLLLIGFKLMRRQANQGWLAWLIIKVVMRLIRASRSGQPDESISTWHEHSVDTQTMS